MPFVQSKKRNCESVNGQLWPRQSFVSFWEGKCVSCDSSIRNTQICFLQPTSTNKRRVLPKLKHFTFRYFILLDDFFGWICASLNMMSFVVTSEIQIGMQQWNYSYVHNKRFHLFGILSLYAAIDFLKDK